MNKYETLCLNILNNPTATIKDLIHQCSDLLNQSMLHTDDCELNWFEEFTNRFYYDWWELVMQDLFNDLVSFDNTDESLDKLIETYNIRLITEKLYERLL